MGGGGEKEPQGGVGIASKVGMRSARVGFTAS
jgi:hypothetical protein